MIILNINKNQNGLKTYLIKIYHPQYLFAKKNSSGEWIIKIYNKICIFILHRAYCIEYLKLKIDENPNKML